MTFLHVGFSMLTYALQKSQPFIENQKDSGKDLKMATYDAYVTRVVDGDTIARLMRINKEEIALSLNDFVSERIKAIEDFLKQSADERRRASMKGKRNRSNQLTGSIGITTYNKLIIEEASKIIEALQEENKELSQTIKDIQSRPPR